MLIDEKIIRFTCLIILNIIILASYLALSNLSYAQILTDRFLEKITKHSPSEYPHINVGNLPRAIGVYSNFYEDIHTVYVANAGDNTVSVIDANNHTKIGNIKVGNGPFAIGVNNFTNMIYVANFDDNTVSVIDARNNTKIIDIAVGKSPAAIGVNKISNTIYVANFGDNTVSVIDANNHTKIGNIKVGNGPFAIGVDEFTYKVFVANRQNDTVSVIDGKNNTKMNDIKVGNVPSAIGVDEFTYKVFVANRQNDTMSVIDGKNNTKIKEIKVEYKQRGIGIDESTHKVFVANPENNTVSVIDGKNNTKIKEIKVGNYPNAIGVDSSTATIYVTNYYDKSVSVINGLVDSVVAKITFKIEPFDAGHIECDTYEKPIAPIDEKPIAPVAKEFYVNASTQCTAIPNEGFDFVSWQENLGGSTQIVQYSSPSSTWDSFLDFLQRKSDKPEAKLNITKFGSFTANFKQVPPAIPGEYLVALFGIVTASIVGWLSPTIISSFNSWREAKIVSKYHYTIHKLYNDKKIDENDMKKLNKLKLNLSHDYAEGKISDRRYENTKNEISRLYQEIYEKKFNSLNDKSDLDVRNELDTLMNEVNDAYADGKINELHFNLLKERILNHDSNNRQTND